jgi:hypothetical protein
LAIQLVPLRAQSAAELVNGFVDSKTQAMPIRKGEILLLTVAVAYGISIPGLIYGADMVNIQWVITHARLNTRYFAQYVAGPLLGSGIAATGIVKIMQGRFVGSFVCTLAGAVVSIALSGYWFITEHAFSLMTPLALLFVLVQLSQLRAGRSHELRARNQSHRHE